MKILLLFALIIPMTSIAQPNEKQLENELHKYQSLKTILSDSLDIIEFRIDSIQSAIYDLELSKSGESNQILTIKRPANLREIGDVSGNLIGRLEKGEKVILLGINNSGYLEVRHGDRIGFVLKTFIVEEDLIDSGLEKIRKGQQQKVNQLKDFLSEIEKNPIWVKSEKANFREAPNQSSQIKKVFNRGQRLFLISTEGEWSKVNYSIDLLPSLRSLQSEDEILDYFEQGWVHSSLLTDDQVRPISNSERAQNQIEQRRKTFVETNPVINSRFKRYILDGKVSLGMSKEMVLASRGNPRDTNRTISSYGTREQWVYGTSLRNREYLYFENGVLTTIQD